MIFTLQNLLIDFSVTKPLLQIVKGIIKKEAAQSGQPLNITSLFSTSFKKLN